tara:strand:- start:1421 stop:1591 length:171 start_codon:yes stop_codon:yes gene_type:complete
MSKKINKVFWIIGEDGFHYYVFNPYLKDAKHCLESINLINETNFKLENIKYWFESY